jgi:MerR family transcriptional regulator, mercuric resistance operon regulatory protein
VAQLGERKGGEKIGELANQTGLSIKTIRYYERRGLLDQPPRTERGYRLY